MLIVYSCPGRNPNQGKTHDKYLKLPIAENQIDTLKIQRARVLFDQIEQVMESVKRRQIVAPMPLQTALHT